MVFRLDPTNLHFPDPALAEPDGLLAFGGDLSMLRLLRAHMLGIFPWYNDDELISWFAPHQRCVLYPQNIKVSNSMRKFLNKNTFTITTNTVFEKVIKQCANIKRKDGPGTWITKNIQQAYINLNKIGVAKSVEVWQNNKLVGGIYGVVVGDIFCGESMFSKVSNASKAAIIWLCQHGGYRLIDCQVSSPHLHSMGAQLISQKEYMDLIEQYFEDK